MSNLFKIHFGLELVFYSKYSVKYIMCHIMYTMRLLQVIIKPWVMGVNLVVLVVTSNYGIICKSNTI